MQASFKIVCEKTQRRASATAKHVPHSAAAPAQAVPDLPQSHEIGKFVDGCLTRTLLVREALTKFASIGLPLLFELDEVSESDAPVATDAIKRDLARVKKFVQVASTHSKARRGLVGRHGGVWTKSNNLAAFAQATDQAG